MIENKDNRVPVKINPDVKERLDAIQYELRVTEVKKPTHSDVIMRALEALKSQARQEPQKEQIVSQARSVYRPANEAWHARLEMVLNDPDEALGIQKNLEWAERTVSQKLKLKRPAGKRAVGE